MRMMVILFSLILAGCAGFTVPFTDHRTAHWMFKTDHNTLNANCIEKPQLQVIATLLEKRHLEFLRSRNIDEAMNIKEFREALGSACETLLVGLTTQEIQTELFGTATNIPSPEKLRELGGVLFAYQDVTTHFGIHPTLHLEEDFAGPDRRLVAIYQLTDGKIIHLQYAGKDDVARVTLHWPVAEFFGIVVQNGIKAILP